MAMALPKQLLLVKNAPLTLSSRPERSEVEGPAVCFHESANLAFVSPTQAKSGLEWGTRLLFEVDR